MREIKFRAWNNKDKEMLEWICLSQSAFNRGDIHLMYDAFTAPRFDDCGFELMQFTGLKDKNEKEIYEGDIVKIKDDNPMFITWSEKFASFVIKKDGWMYAHWFGESYEPNQVEIIGNIYENPELLKK